MCPLPACSFLETHSVPKTLDGDIQLLVSICKFYHQLIFSIFLGLIFDYVGVYI